MFSFKCLLMYNSYTNVIIFYFRSRKRRGSETVSEEGGSSSEESLKRVSSSRRRNMRLREGGDEKRTLTSSPIMSECTAAMVSKYFIFHQILSLLKNSDGWFFGQLNLCQYLHYSRLIGKKMFYSLLYYALLCLGEG